RMSILLSSNFLLLTSNFFLLLLRQREYIQRVARCGRMNVWRDGGRHETRAAAAVPGRHGDVLPAVDAERHREALDRRAEARLPQDLSRLHVKCAEHAIEIADEREAAGRRDRRRHERRALRVRPVLFQCADVEGAELADVAVAARHLVEPPSGAAAAAAAFLLLDFLRVHLETALAERDDQLVVRLVIRGRRPVVAALGARASLYPYAELLLEEIGRASCRERVELSVG